ncbi:MAG: phosphoglycerate kinase [Chitinivibrionales bacterium]
MGMHKLFVEDLDVKGKRVIVRVDFNVPLNEKGEITNDNRIVASLPTINYLVNNGAKVILMSHLGRPKGEKKPEFSLRPVSEALAEKVDARVGFVEDCVGPEVEKAVSELSDGEILLLENLRYYKEEKKNDPEFAGKLARLADLYVNDAFGTAHRAHASTEGITKYMDECAAGYLIKKEIEYIGGALENPQKPFAAILGGAKISGKIDVIRNLLGRVDVLCIGGGMAYTFFKAMGLEIGNSLLEEDKIELAGELMKEAETSSTNLVLPVDCAAGKEFSNDTEKTIVSRDKIPADLECMDIGPETIKLFSDKIRSAKTVVWNGPMGVFEFSKFADGTNAVAEVLAESTDNGAITIIGGGDSASAIHQAGLTDRMSHISTGGGASLEYLEGKELPGIAALSDRVV